MIDNVSVRGHVMAAGGKSGVYKCSWSIAAWSFDCAQEGLYEQIHSRRDN